MKKTVVYIAILSLFFALAACNDTTPNNSSKTENTKKEWLKKPTKKPVKTEKQKEDSLISLNEIQQKADPLALDSAANKLPEPENPEEINWDTEEEMDVTEVESQPDSLQVTDVEDIDYDHTEPEDEPIDLVEGDVPLRREKMLSTEIVFVKIPDYRSTKDSILDVIEERMSIHPKETEQKIVVEKWFSPVNFRGYKFNRKKLMLYGVDKNDEVSIYYYLGEYYLEFNNRMFYLDETTKNVGFGIVKDSLIVNYLRNYDY